jgi:hypothetical protein
VPKYETITDKLDGRTFSGNNVTLTAAEVDSGLVLQSNYRGGAHPVATLALTANAKDPVTGAVTTSAPQTITVTDPRPAATTTTTSRHHPATTATHHHATTATHHNAITATHHHATAATHHHTATVTNPPSSTSTSSGVPTDHVSSPVATTVPKPITVTDPAPAAASTTTASPANHGLALFSQIRDLVANSGVATSAPQSITVADPASATGKSTASLASQSFALLNQYLAGNAGRVDPGQIVAAVSNGTGWGQDSFLTRPQH